MGNNVFPIAFNNVGELVLSDEFIQFYVNPSYSNIYRGINKSNTLFISYNQITDIEWMNYRMAFIQYFDIIWIKISYLDNGINKHLLVSNSGKGFAMNKIKRKNKELMNLIKNKIDNNF